jgi:DNA-binding PadR family transcriptional regulator
MKSEIVEETEKSMIKNFLDIIVLAELRKSSPLSGYDVLELIHKKFDVLISSGTIYSLLYSMERKGLIEGKLTEGKRVYALTEKGTDAISAFLKSKEELQRFLGTLF